MTQEEKQLLLQDLCTRLPYGIILQVGIFDNGDIKYYNKKLDYQLLSLIELDGGYYSNGLLCKYHQFTAKPYLRPMSSMTEEEKIELKQLSNEYLDEWENTKTSLERWKLDAKVSYKRAVFYNSHHLDWNDLISKDLAIAVTEENNPYKE